MSEKEEMNKTQDVITDTERELAQTALNEFKKKNIIVALQCINKLDNRNNDFKVAHNKALVEYFKSDLRKTDTFQKNLTSICNQFKLNVEKLDDVDQCILHFNQAVLLYHQRNFTDAIRIMDRVYKFIEPMDDTLAKQVSLFAIELQLSIKQPEKALSIISYVENQLINGTPNIKILDKSMKEKEKKPDPFAEEFKRKLVKYKARCYLMNHQLDIAHKEIKLLIKDKSNNNNALFLSANLEYLKGNLQESLTILNNIPKDYLLYNECGESSSVMYYNNMGVLHQAMGKPNLACHYFQMALKEDLKLCNTKKDLNEKPLFTLGSSKYHEIIYNLGVALLYAKKPNQAFECLVIAVRRFHRNSRLWLRLAECCIMLHKESNEIDFDQQKKQKELIIDIVGTKDKQKIILTTNLSKDKKYTLESQSYAVPVPSLEFAFLCLRNAQFLLPSNIPINPVPLFLIPGVTPPLPTSAPGNSPSSPLTNDSLINLRNSILAASSYVTLCLGDYVLSLENAKNLLEQPCLSSVHKLLGHLYCAEALVLSDKINDALEHLNPDNIKDISFDLPTDPNDSNDDIQIKTHPPLKWFPNNLASIHAVMQYNIAVAKTIRGQSEEAVLLLKQVWELRNTCKIPAHIIMLVIYIELQMGHADAAKNLIKQYLNQRKFI